VVIKCACVRACVRGKGEKKRQGTGVVANGGTSAIEDDVELVGSLGAAALLSIAREVHHGHVDRALVQLQLRHDHPLVGRVLVLDQPGRNIS